MGPREAPRTPFGPGGDPPAILIAVTSSHLESARFAIECAVCPVCRLAIGDRPPRTCERCETPHHADCWDYLEGCGMYACDRARLEADLETRREAGIRAMEADGALVLLEEPDDPEDLDEVGVVAWRWRDLMRPITWAQLPPVFWRRVGTVLVGPCLLAFDRAVRHPTLEGQVSWLVAGGLLGATAFLAITLSEEIPRALVWLSGWNPELPEDTRRLTG